jgi:hypothetical protein
MSVRLDVFYQDTMQGHMALSGQSLLNKNKMAVFPNLPFTPNQNPCDFFFSQI